MTHQQRMTYNALLESDKMYGRNEAKEYLKKNKLTFTKETVSNYMKEERDNIINNTFEAFWSIRLGGFYIIMFVLSLFFDMGHINSNLEFEFSEIGLLLTALIILSYIGFWGYSFFSIMKNDFYKDINKISWVVSIIFIPFSFILYLDFKDTQTIK